MHGRAWEDHQHRPISEAELAFVHIPKQAKHRIENGKNPQVVMGEIKHQVWLGRFENTDHLLRVMNFSLGSTILTPPIQQHNPTLT